MSDSLSGQGEFFVTAIRGITKPIHTEIPVNKITNAAFYKWKHLHSICLCFMHQFKCDCHPTRSFFLFFLYSTY